MTRFWPKMGRFTRFTRFTRPACNAKHTYASTRVLRPLLIVATTLRKHISSDVRPKNWPELILGLCPTAPEGVGCVFFRVTASRAKRAFWPMASPLASLAGWIMTKITTTKITGVVLLRNIFRKTPGNLLPKNKLPLFSLSS